ncbi:MAG: WG repeat-containing protein [Firmicutes bacterium]|nr:WG repeat-containing protein [Bacillota bacterium]
MKKFTLEKINRSASVKKSLVPFAVLLGFSVLFVLVQSGALPIPGFEPPALTPYISVYNSRFTASGSNDLLSSESSADAGRKAGAADVSMSFPSAAELTASGYRISAARFGSASEVGFADASVFSPSAEFSFSAESKYDSSVTNSAETQDVPVLETKMGFVFRHNRDSGTALYDRTGYLIYESIPDTLSFTGERDRLDRAVFSDNGKYVVWDYTTHSFTAADYNPALDSRGVKGCVPQYWGKSDGELTVAAGENGLLGYKRGDSFIIAPIYAKAYPFREGLAVACGDDGRLHILNSEGAELFSELSLYAPDTDGAESMGFYCFDGGVMLARLSETDADGNTSKTTVALKSDGTVLSLPGGYSPVSYSDGAILLEKNGRYGFMNTDGKWLCDPLYTYASPFFEGLATVGGKDGKKGIIDLNGNFVIPAVFDYISYCQDGVITLYDKQSGWCLLNKLTNE